MTPQLPLVALGAAVAARAAFFFIGRWGERRLGQRVRQVAVEQRRRLEALAGLSAAEAKKELVRQVEDEAKAEAANLVRNIKDQARREADREAKKIVAIAIGRIASDQTAETTISTVT